jgi:hypothetical protein
MTRQQFKNESQIILIVLSAFMVLISMTFAVSYFFVPQPKAITDIFMIYALLGTTFNFIIYNQGIELYEHTTVLEAGTILFGTLLLIFYLVPIPITFPLLVLNMFLWTQICLHLGSYKFSATTPQN